MTPEPHTQIVEELLAEVKNHINTEAALSKSSEIPGKIGEWQL